MQAQIKAGAHGHDHVLLEDSDSCQVPEIHWSCEDSDTSRDSV